MLRKDPPGRRRLVHDHPDSAVIVSDCGHERHDVDLLGPQRGAYFPQHSGPIFDPSRQLLRLRHRSIPPCQNELAGGFAEKTAIACLTSATAAPRANILLLSLPRTSDDLENVRAPAASELER